MYKRQQVYRLKALHSAYALYFITGILVTAVFLANLVRDLAQRTLIRARTLLVKRIREALFEKINNLHLGFFTREHKGDLISRMNSDVFEIEGVAAGSLEVLIREPVSYTHLDVYKRQAPTSLPKLRQ